MDSKFTLALIALVGIGVFALPSTMSLFAGQHAFYNIDATGNQVPCQKCHGDVKAELVATGYSATTGTKGPHADFKCEYCHRAEAGFASGDDAYARIEYINEATGDKIALVTTIQNFERGNFPKAINYVSGLTTVDNWNTSNGVYNLDSTPFVATNYTDVNGQYAGSLQPTTLGANGIYNYSSSSEVPTQVNGAPRDTNAATQNTAFNPRALDASHWSGSAVSNLNGAGSREVTPGTRYHAASLVSCLECHGGEQKKGVAGYEISASQPYNHAGWLVDTSDTNSKCSNCHYGSGAGIDSEFELAAGGFGITGFANDTGVVEAHNAFVQTPATGGQKDTVDRYGYGASNGACIACHTHVAVDINFQKGYKLSFDAIESSAGQYQVGNFNVEGKVNVAIYGNGSGETYAVGNKTYNWTPTQTLYINGGNATIVGLDSVDKSDSAAALQS